MTYTLDFTALVEPLTKADINAYKLTAPKRKKSTIMTVLLSFLVILAGMGVLMLLFVAITEFEEGGPFLLFVMGGVGLMFWLPARSAARERAKLYKFAVHNNLQLVAGFDNPSYPGMIFDNGHSRQVNNALRFGNGTEIGNFTYVTGSGKNRTTHNWGYVKIKLVRRLPHMILDAKVNNFWKFSNLSDSFDRSQVLSLEGDFNNYFTLYAPRQYERDALYVFTPDVMLVMIDYGKEYDIEIVDDDLFIYSSHHFTLDKPDFYERILAITNTISSKLIDQTNYYADERTGNRAVDIIAPQGQRLKSSFNWLIVIIIAIIIYFNIIQPLLFR